jgi:Zn-finger nucleic acid-binding protein
MICPNCQGKEEMREDKRGYHVCPKCLGEWWPPDKPERGEYKKSITNISSPGLMIWHDRDINYKEPLPAGEPIFKGSSKSGKKRKKPLKRIVGIPYET